MTDYYEALGVANDATAAIVKIAFEGKMKALAKAPASPERQAEERLLQQAYATLSNAQKREWYDRQLEARDKPRSSIPVPVMIGALVVVAAIAGGWYLSHRSADSQLTEAQKEQVRQKMLEDRKKNADWGKATSDAQRMQEISRRRAEEQRARSQSQPAQ